MQLSGSNRYTNLLHKCNLYSTPLVNPKSNFITYLFFLGRFNTFINSLCSTICVINYSALDKVILVLINCYNKQDIAGNKKQ